MVTSTVPKNKKVSEWQIYPKEREIAQLIDALDDIRTKGRKGKAAIHMSFSYAKGAMTDPYLLAFRKQSSSAPPFFFLFFFFSSSHHSPMD
jgi:hypothetical protein